MEGGGGGCVNIVVTRPRSSNTELSSIRQKFKPSIICTNFEHFYFETNVLNKSHFIDPITCLEMAKNCHIDSKTYLFFVYKQKK